MRIFSKNPALCFILVMGLAVGVGAREVGPDAFGYRATDEIGYFWEGLAPAEGGSGATEINQDDWINTGEGHWDDDGYVEIPIGFDFQFYGNTKTNLFITSNGLLVFDTANTEYSNSGIPDPQAPNAFIAPFWDDLYPGGVDTNLLPNDGKVYYQVFGTTPHQRLVVEYYRVPHYSDENSRLTFETILSEGGDIRFQYKEMQDGAENFGTGLSATLGIEDETGGRGIEWFRGDEGLPGPVTNGLAIQFTVDRPADILVLQEQCSDSSGRVWQALNNLGSAYAYVSTENAVTFLDQLQNGGPWRLLVIDEYSGPLGPVLTAALADYVTDGGRVIISHCYWSEAGLADIFEAAHVSTYSTPIDLYRWEPAHPIFNTPHVMGDLTGPYSDTCADDGGKFNPIIGGVALGGYTVTAQGDEAGIILGNNGRTILDGQVFDVYDSEQIVDLIENEIVFLLAQGGIEFSTNLLAYTGTYGGSNPADQTVGLTNIGIGSLTYSNVITYSAGASGWLNIEPAAGIVDLSNWVILTNRVNLTGVNAGTHTATNTLFSDATNSPQSYTVVLTLAAADQTIAFPAILPQKVSATVVLDATASSGLGVGFTFISGPGLISGGSNLTFTGEGDVEVKASQSGNGNYNAATEVSQNIKVFSVTPDTGPFAGGISIIITNGYFGSITNVLIDGVTAALNAQGASWATVTVPALGSGGIKDIVIQTSDEGDITLPGAYTVCMVGSLLPLGSVVYDESWTWNGAPLGWRVVDTNYGGQPGWVTLQGTNGLGGRALIDSGWANRWPNATLRTWLNSSNFFGLFSPGFSGIVMRTSVPWALANPTGLPSSGVATDQVFIASWTELGGGPLGDDGSVLEWFADSGTAAARRADLSPAPMVYWTRTGDHAWWSGVWYDMSAFYVAVTSGAFSSGAWTSDPLEVVPVVNINGAAQFAIQPDGRFRLFGPLDQTISFPNPGNQQTNAQVALSAVASSGLDVTYQVVAGPAALLDETNLIFAGVGEVTVLAAQTGNGYWNPADEVSNTFTVKASQAELIFTPTSPQTYATTQTLTTTGGSGNGMVNFAVESGVGQIVGGDGLWVTSGTGTVTVVATRAGDDFYEPASATATVTAAKASQLITFNAIPDQETTNGVMLTATSSSGLPVSFALSSGPGVLSGGSNLTFSTSGTVSLIASQLGNDDWAVALEVTNTFEVTKALATVLLHGLSQVYDGTPRVVTASTVPTGLTVAVTYNGSASAPTSVDLYAIIGTVQDALYAGIGNGFLNIGPGGQTLDFASIPNQRTNAVWHLSATTRSGLPVIFTVVSGPGTITGGTNLTFSGTGWVSVVASQAGDANWTAAPDVTRIFRVGIGMLPTDYDGDGKSDLAVYDLNRGNWYIYSESGGVLAWQWNWGYAGALPVEGDYNGDGRADPAVYDEQNGLWSIRELASGTVLAFNLQWGFNGTDPVPGDYDGDGKTDLAVYDRAQGRWYIRTLEGTLLAWNLNWGHAGTEAVAADFDGDGSSDLAVYDLNQGTWFVRNLTGEVLVWNLNWGYAGARPVPADYNGDAMADLGVQDEITGNWFVWSLAAGRLAWYTQWGFNGGLTVPGDYNGDGRADLSIYGFDRLAPVYHDNGEWFVRDHDVNVYYWHYPWGATSLWPVGARLQSSGR